jgi:multiple sugar transport system permease protein
MTMPRAWLHIFENSLKYILLIILAIFALFPIVWIMSTSLKTRADIFASTPMLFTTPSIDAYVKFLTPGPNSVYRFLFNSILVSMGTVGAALTLASLAAYSFSRYRFAGRNQMLYVILGTRLLPPITAVIPLYLLMRSLSLIDTPLVLIIIYTALNVPFATWMMKSFFDTIPRELEEAAQIDGCSALRALWHVTIPLAAPGFVATSIFLFVLAWNEFMFAFIFTNVRARTVPVVVAETMGEMQIFWQDMASLATILIIPALIFALFAQRYMVKGLTAGSLK